VTNVERNKEVLMYSSPKEGIEHIAVHVSAWPYILINFLLKILCEGLEEVLKITGCSHKIGTEILLQWHCPLYSVVCSAAIDCCSTGVRVKLSAVK
jgi:hypothetical protein